MDTLIRNWAANPKRYSAKTVVKPVTFRWLDPQANHVTIMGDFNGWNPHSHPLQRMPDGSWRIELPLSHGHHQYLFVVDGEPKLDPSAHGIGRDANNQRVSLIAVS